ncbi:hypothetical protein C8J56DRAFT_776545 [Mycena floridula]|nr:hypothetical protein C8J56DRAFT_776545 [Mycena floridula]
MLSYRMVTAFGRAIRRFARNVSDMSGLAARNFEDLLQCAYPCFEDLLDNKTHNKILLELIFVLSTWHALAKLRMHTDFTLAFFRHMTHLLGTHLRRFKSQLCPHYRTKELAKETEARSRRKTKKKTTKSPKKTSKMSTSNDEEPTLKEFSLETPKLHSLGHYPDSVPLFGTTDSHTSQTVSRVILN